MLTDIAAPPPPPLHLVTQLSVSVAAPLELGSALGTSRRMIPITGGAFEGPLLRGEILPGGADWQFTRPDGVTVLNARYTLKTAQGHLISVINSGFRHGAPNLSARLLAGDRILPSEYYFVTTPLFECTAPELQWLTRSAFIGVGERRKECVQITVWKVGDEPRPKAT